MKVYLNNYRHHWLSPYTIIDCLFFWTDWSHCHRDKSLARVVSNLEHESIRQNRFATNRWHKQGLLCGCFLPEPIDQ